IADAMRVRWGREDGWLQFRSASFYNDRLKEVPNRLLRRWADSRKQRGALSLDDVVEIAQLPDAQLDAREMGEGAKRCFGLAEWELPRQTPLRPPLRFLAALQPPQRQQAVSQVGLGFRQMTLAQQQAFIALALGAQADRLRSLEELADASLRVD